MSEDIKAKSLNIENLVDYQKDTVVSREVIKKELGTVTFFAFDKGQGLSEHSAPFDAMVQVIDGEAEITISGNKNIVKNVILKFEEEICILKNKVEELENRQLCDFPITDCGLNLSCLTDTCDNTIITVGDLLQSIINKVCET